MFSVCVVAVVVMDDVLRVVVPDSKGKEDDACLCKRCSEVRAVKDFEECHHIHREQSRYTLCGLVHRDYDISTLIIDEFDSFNCDVYISIVDELQMNDNETILLPEHDSKTDRTCAVKNR
jgi:hypothetical protein